MPLFKSITRVFHHVPVVGTVIRETARVADQVTNPVQSVAKSAVNEVTGSRKRNNRRLDAQKEQLIREAQQRVEINRQRDEDNIRQIMADEIAALRLGIENAEREISNEVIDAEVDDIETIIPNPFFAYEECRLGTTQELTLILQMDRNNDLYNFFMDLNPLREAYLYFIDSNINIDALRMLSSHDDPRVVNSKVDLLLNVLNDLHNAVVQANFNKVRNINSACIQIEGERAFLDRLSRQQSLYQPLIDANIIHINSGEITLQEQQSSSSSSSPRPRP